MLNWNFKSFYIGSEIKVFYFWRGTLVPLIGICVNVYRGCLVLKVEKGGYVAYVNIFFKNIAYFKILKKVGLDRFKMSRKFLKYKP